MRVISGSAKGKKLFSLEGLETRPTLDRVKEAVFNILQFKIKDAVILDLFSGSGALGIEALSRGAKEAFLCDNSDKAIKIIQKNLEATKLSSKVSLINKDYLETLKDLKSKSLRLDIVFLDPPYKSNYVEKSIEHILEYDLLAEDGIIVVETDDKEKINKIKENSKLEVYDTRKYGIALIIFIRKG